MSEVERRKNPKRKTREVVETETTAEGVEKPTTRPRSGKKKLESSTPIADRSREEGEEQDSLAKGDSFDILPHAGHSSSAQVNLGLNLGTADSTSREEGRGDATDAPPHAGDGNMSDENDQESPGSAPPAVVRQVAKKKKDYDWTNWLYWIDTFMQLACYAAGIGLSCLLMKQHIFEWITDQMSKDGDEAFAGKIAVLMFPMFWYCLVTWMDKVLTTIQFLSHILFPEQHAQLVKIVRAWSFLVPLSYPYYYQILLPFCTWYGIKYWLMIWDRFICKSRYDKSCQNNTLGILLSNFRKKGCYEEDGSYSIMCDRMIAILPLFFLCLLAAVIGTCLQSIFNHYLLSKIYMNRRQQNENEPTTQAGDRTNDQSDPDEDETETETSEANTEQIISDSE